MAYNFYNPYQSQMMNYGQYQQQNTIQNGGFVRVPNETAARNYPIAPGNSITFIDENAPYCYTMTMGFSQFDRPKFEKFRLVKEEDQPIQAQENLNNPTEIENLQAEIKNLQTKTENLQTEIENLKTVFAEKSAKMPSKTEKEVDVNE